MSYKYFPHTEVDVRQMLDVCGVASLDELYADIPEHLQLHRDYNLPRAMSEVEVTRFFDELASKNQQLVCFAGGGCQDHYAPAVIGSVLQRSEFLTSYTPYQAEISQGTLQYIFEFQSMMASLTGMEVSNASMYDGSTATAEAMMMAVAASKKRNKVLVSSTLNPRVRRVVDTYARFHGVELCEITQEGGVSSKEHVMRELSAGDVAGVIVATPNYYGIVEDLTGWSEACEASKALLIVHCDAQSLAVTKSPGEWGAHIAVGDAQSLGIPMSFGGPFVGFLCTSKKLIRKMPGRIVGATTDLDGKKAFVLTLQAREQHIRREKATSNICSNQSLMALYVTVYLALMGEKGLKEVNERGADAAHYLAQQLTDTGKMRLMFPDKPFINEFAMTSDIDVDTLQSEALKHGILAGVKLDNNSLLLCATEMRTKQEIDKLVDLVRNL